MEQYVVKRLTYAASYELLKRLAEKKRITKLQLEELSILMAECQVCDPIISHSGGKSKSP